VDRLNDARSDRQSAHLASDNEVKAPSQAAEMIYAARQAAGLTQRQLAKAIGAKQQVISQLEDADCRGRSLTMLQRIAHALDLELEVRFKPRPKRRPARRSA
jgi:transcriptional regulator with XRE-family HTH domain